jgi:hypothetical protein
MTELKDQDTLQIYTPSEEPGVTFCVANNDEMLRITKDAFYVRGQPVAIDVHEAETVYNAFNAWLTWANMRRH